MHVVAPVDVMEDVNSHVKADAPVVGNHSIFLYNKKEELYTSNNRVPFFINRD